MFTRNGKALTARGTKPICPFHQVFKSTFLFGAFSPMDGSSFLLELPYCNTESFQIYLDEFSKTNSDELKILVLDNGQFHKAKRLKLPKNIIIVFLPPYSPELNPAEKIWAKFKRAFTNKLNKSLDQLSSFIETQAKSLTLEQTKKICAFDYILNCPNWTI